MSQYKPKPCADYPGWYEIPGYPRYAANRKGEILTKKTENPTKGGNGGRYLRVSVYAGDSDTPTLEYAHDLICLAFRGPRPAGHVVAHKNNNRKDNSALNLSWKTQSDNIKDTYKDGLRKPANGYTVNREDFLATGFEIAGSTLELTTSILKSLSGKKGGGVVVKTSSEVDKAKAIEFSLRSLFPAIFGDSKALNLSNPDQASVISEGVLRISRNKVELDSWLENSLTRLNNEPVILELTGLAGSLFYRRKKVTDYLQAIESEFKYWIDIYDRAREDVSDRVNQDKRIRDALKKISYSFTSEQSVNEKTALAREMLRKQGITDEKDRLKQARPEDYPKYKDGFFGEDKGFFSSYTNIVVRYNGPDTELQKYKTEVRVRGTEIPELVRLRERMNAMLEHMATAIKHDDEVQFLRERELKPFAKDLHATFLKDVQPNWVYSTVIHAQSRIWYLESMVSILLSILFLKDKLDNEQGE